MSDPGEKSRAPIPATGEPPASGLSRRAVGVALLLLLLLLPASFFVEQVTNSSRGFSERVPPIAGLGLTFLLTVVTQVWARRHGRGLGRQGILTVYVLLTIGGPLVSLGVMLWFLSCSMGPQFYVRIMPQWQNAFFQYIPTWFHPGDPAAIEGFFMGQSRVPWAEWWIPLAAWGSALVALFVGCLCLFLLVRRQWINDERLTFPIAQVPLELVRESPDGHVRLPASGMFWLGFGACALLYLQERLPELYPSLPHLEIWGFTVFTAGQTGPMVGFGDLWLYLLPWLIALAFLMPKELSFSMWFFWFVRVACTIIAIAAGASPRKPEEWGDSSFPAPHYQGGGAMLAICLLALWAGRKQILRALQHAWRGTRDPGDSLPSRWIVLALLASVGYLVLFCYRAGMRPGVALALVGLILTIHVVWARLRAENGMSFIGYPFTVGDFLFKPLGTGFYRPAEVVTILATRWAYTPGWGEGTEVIAGASMDALKISEAARLPRRPLVLAMLGVFVFALVVGIFVELTGTYHYGFTQFAPMQGGWEHMVPGTGEELYSALTNPTKPDPAGAIGLLGGLAFTLLLAQLRLRFWWWPLHPVGYLAANVWGSHWWWSPLFIGWLLKTLTIRYGGLRLYQRLIPAAIGVIVADSTFQMLAGVLLCVVRSVK
jgi:hypothetical protein